MDLRRFSESMKKALEFATKAHSGQYRQSGEEYITHPIHVMNRMKIFGFSDYVLQAALLHDVCEDTPTTNKEIKSHFGPKVAYLVDKLTKDPKEKFSVDEEGQYVRLQKYLKKLEKGAANEPAVLFIKMCDQLDNLGSVPVFSEQKYYRKLWEIKMYYISVYQRCQSKIPKKMKKNYIELLNELQTRVNSLLDVGHQKAQTTHDTDQMVERVMEILRNSKVSFTTE